MTTRLPKVGSQDAMSNDEVEFLKVRHWPIFQQCIAAGRVFAIFQLVRHLFRYLRLALQRQWNQFLSHALFRLLRRLQWLFLLIAIYHVRQI